ncbi:MAG: hypothetical protein QOG46_116 [Pseudonocardiales bacterium]|nr:hypothetical protein [Pseudonocardiales bacterium]
MFDSVHHDAKNIDEERASCGLLTTPIASCTAEIDKAAVLTARGGMWFIPGA